MRMARLAWAAWVEWICNQARWPSGLLACWPESEPESEVQESTKKAPLMRGFL
jgi:hypothetical protein